MVRISLLFAVVALAGCGKGTCIQKEDDETGKYPASELCFVNNPKRTCDSAGARHSEYFSEDGKAGLERCKAAGFTEAYPSMTKGQVDDSLEKGEMVTMSRPLGVPAKK